MIAMYANASSVVCTAPSTADCATPTTNANRHQAVTSSIAAQLSATTPSSVFSMLRSVRMRASTGNAVIDIATPMNSAKLVNGTSAVPNRGYSHSARIAAQQKRRDDAGVRDGHRGVGPRAQQPGVELQADQEHVQDDADLRDDFQRRAAHVPAG